MLHRLAPFITVFYPQLYIVCSIHGRMTCADLIYVSMRSDGVTRISHVVVSLILHMERREGCCTLYQSHDENNSQSCLLGNMHALGSGLTVLCGYLRNNGKHSAGNHGSARPEKERLKHRTCDTYYRVERLLEQTPGNLTLSSLWRIPGTPTVRPMRSIENCVALNECTVHHFGDESCTRSRTSDVQRQQKHI